MSIEGGASRGHRPTRPPRLAYFAFVIDAVEAPELESLRDSARAVGIYTLEGARSWFSPFGAEDFTPLSGNALERFLRDILEDCMQKGPAEILTFESSYELLAQYFGWKIRSPQED